jgi:3D (Asp-Asp-Asp) domain-containing protein
MSVIAGGAPRRRGWVGLVLLATVVGCGSFGRDTKREQPGAHERAERMAFEATAYSQEGKTASGTPSRQGIVAADPKVLPFGTRIRVSDAGQYSGEYVVRDTGRTIKGREIDVYLANDGEAKRFGRKTVQVEVLSYGDGRPVVKR